MKLNEILGTKYPIIQGGMANISNGKFAASVSNSGALGVIGAGGMSPDELRKEIRECKSLTDKPFGVNLMLLHPEIDLLAELVVEEGVKVLTTGAGNPGKYVEYWKSNGIKVFPVVSSPVLAIRLAETGVDGIIAEGTEGGGHIGEMTTMTLIPQVIEKVNIPVIGAGGIASGKQMLAAKVLGAVGVQIGTVLLATEECPIHENYKEAIVKAKDRNVVVVGRICGIPVRVLKNTMTRNYLKDERRGASKEELEIYVLGALRKAVKDGDTKEGSLMAGLVVGQIKEISTVDKVLSKLMDEYSREWRGLND